MLQNECNLSELSIKTTLFSHLFHPLSCLLVVAAKEENFIKSQYEMLKFNNLMHKVSRVTIVVVQVGAVKIYVIVVKAK